MPESEPLPHALESQVLEILDLPPAGRQAPLDALYAAHPEHAPCIRLRLARAGELLAGLDRAFAAADAAPPRPEWIGPYRVLEQLGEGGMGTVWLAEQGEPVRRRVAVKVIKAGTDTRQVLTRFALEQQALALMNHENIARVFDAGTTADGRPWFAMEHVPGPPITRYCDEQRLPIEERVRLFAGVCAGVEHAHQKGVIHRDLTARNVLVAEQQGRPVPKIIDFGLARAMDRDLAGATQFTERHVLLGTPAYMSPEQAAPGEGGIDTRTDVWSLGVLLYELLTGTLPFPAEGLRRAGADQLRRRIAEGDLPKPSTRIASMASASTTEIAARRQSALPALQRRLRGDLDWIVLRCLERDRERRYPAASALAADLRHHLAHEPVAAGPPSAGYRLRKLVRRHRGRVAAAAAVLLALVAGTIAATLFALRAADNAELASGQAQKLAIKVAEFDMLANIVHLREARAAEQRLHPAAPGNVTALRQWLDDAARLVAALPGLRGAVAALRARGGPPSTEQLAAARRAHPDTPRLERLCAWREVLQRALDVHAGRTSAPVAELTPAEQALSARELVALGNPLIIGLFEQRVFGQEARACAAMRLAVAKVEGGDHSIDLDVALTMLAEALSECGLDDQAKAVAGRAAEASVARGQSRFDGVAAMIEHKANARQQRLAGTIQELDRLEANVVTGASWRFAAESDRFLHDTLGDLIRDLEAFEATTMVDVVHRLAWADRVEELSVERWQPRWAEARGALALADGVVASRLYAACPIDLRPQIGLAPIGMNPVTGLWEFYHLRSSLDPASGTLPKHEPDGSIPVGADTGIVFVLVPGGPTWIGAQSADRSGPNHDPDARGTEQPHQVVLAPFLLARHEMTQGQWRRLGNGDNPSCWRAGVTSELGRFTLANPVECVDWEACRALLARDGLELPTEVQWEHACRAGTTTEWSTGAERESLTGAANIADATARRARQQWLGIDVWPAFDDGFILHTTVDALRPNRWGFHHMHGNVAEWCRDWFGTYSLPCSPGDGERIVKNNRLTLCVRGGSYLNSVLDVRSAVRMAVSPMLMRNDLGLRAARALD